MIVCGREINAESLEAFRIQSAALSQRQRALRLCQLYQWVGPSGRLQLSLGREILRRLEPAQLRAGPGRHQGRSQSAQVIEVSPVQGDLESVQPVELILVPNGRSDLYQIWKGLLERYHYLGAGPLCGAQLGYLIQSPQGWIGALAFSAAALHLASRDRWIRWSAVARRENLHLVVNNSRLLIVPSVQVAHLASHVLGLAAQQLAHDWQGRYGYQPVLLESFVDRTRFSGGSYRAANWQAIGLSAGRGRQDREHRAALSQKIIWVYPLDRNFRQLLCTEPALRRLHHPVPRPAPARPPPEDWAQGELAGSLWPNQRLYRRACLLLRDFFARPQAQVPQACGSRAKTKAAYRFFDHRQVNLPAVLKGHYEASVQRARAERVILAVQDTTELNYSAHPATEQLGPIGDGAKHQVGLLMHETMLYNLEGTPLGLLDVQCWVREDERVSDHRRRPIEEKESYKWLKSFAAASRLQAQCPETQVVSMGDRESDLHELFVQAQEDEHRTKLLVRVCQDRRLVGSEAGFLWGHLQGQAAVAAMELKVPRKKNQPARTARVEVRYGAVELAPPLRKQKMPAVQLWAVWVVEVEPPPGVKPVEWMLLTNLPVESPEAALEKVQWYCLRFQIEVYHRTLKSGCKIEERQLGSAERIESCLALDLIVAWRVVHLTRLGRETPEVPCTVFFEEAQWQAIMFFMTKKPPPRQPPSLRTIQLMVAQLGGFLGRKSDGHPGTKSIWLGLQRSDDITEMWLAIKSLDSATLLSLLDSS